MVMVVTMMIVVMVVMIVVAVRAAFMVVIMVMRFEEMRIVFQRALQVERAAIEHLVEVDVGARSVRWIRAPGLMARIVPRRRAVLRA